MSALKRIAVTPTLILALSVFTYNSGLAQCSASSTIEFLNPSFEGTPAPHVTPAPWSVCSYTPDTQPGTWGVTQSASEGDTYIGMVAAGTWLEGVSQELVTPLVAGGSYSFSVDLSATTASGGGLNPSVFNSLEVWGGDSVCNRDELLWTSPVIDHIGWQTYFASFTPSATHDFIYFVVNGDNNGYLMMDNLQTPEPGPDAVEILSLSDSAIVSCQFLLSGLVDSTNIDSLVVMGDFINSPITIAVNDSVWAVDLAFDHGGYEGVSVTAYGADSTNTAQICSQVGLTIFMGEPVADFSFTGACSNTQFAFQDLSVPFDTNSMVAWSWDFGGLGTSTDQNPLFVFDTIGGILDVHLTATSSDGCSADTTISVTVLPNPDADFTFTEVCLGGTTNFHDFSIPFGGPLVLWQWNLGDGNVSTQSDPVYTYQSAGTFTASLTVTDINGCMDTETQDVEVFTCASIHDQEAEESVAIYPNPTKDVLFIRSEMGDIERVRLFDPAGKLVMDNAGKTIISQPIQTAGLASGIYVLELNLEEIGIVRKQLIIR